VAALGISIVTVASSEYPELLRQVYDPPPFLYVKGKLHHDDRNAVAIVGSRNASEYGLRVAESLSRDLVRCGLTVVSGLARGIDARAHAAALSGGGRTIAVLGCGVDVVYPPELKRLYAAIAEQGALVSEYAPGTRPLSYHFPARNRIISGMCRGVAVVEASPKSGSLITARLAAEQGREVFAVPGNVYSYKTRGTHMLLKSGAKLVDDVRDIVEELRLPVIVDAAVDMNLGADEQSVFSSIDGDPVHVDEILERSGLAAGRLAAVLLELELNGLIKQMPGKRYVKA
ncbi:MAG: DNA-protecting protein DprA, partial [Deltaproteobacteria bacterium]|nr:DNA-protecting protein DprA [Deltaproteobacteria bacterium]